jgi:hypothetical protein
MQTLQETDINRYCDTQLLQILTRIEDLTEAIQAHTLQ